MPIPGGVVALQQSLSFYPAVQRRRRGSSFVPGGNSPVRDPEVLAFNKAQQFFKENVKCSMMLFKDIIPSTLDRIHGVLIVETKEEVAHNGIFILMKGLSLPPKKRQMRRMEGNEHKLVTSLKFVVLGYSRSPDSDDMMVLEEGSRESYPVELDFPRSMKDLPPPLITTDGGLQYRLQVFMTTTEGRHVQIGETKIRFQGCHSLTENLEEDVEKLMRIPFQVQSKRSILALGRKKTINLEFSLGSCGYLPQEHVDFTLVAQTQDKPTRLEYKVELVQKVWFQVPVQGRRRMSVKMKINVVAETEVHRVDVEPGKDVIEEGRLQVPIGLTPTYKFDFMNSISYIIRVGVGIQGEKDGWVSREAPVSIGNTRDGKGYEQEEEDEDRTGEGWSCDASPNRSGAETPQMRASQSLTFIPFRERNGSISSVRSGQSQVSSTASVFRFPPSYSQLSSRRPTLETLPPSYCELQLRETDHFHRPDGVHEQLQNVVEWECKEQS